MNRLDLAFVLLGSIALCGAPVGQSRPRAAEAPAADGQKIIDRAWGYLGGADRIKAVRSFEFNRNAETTVRVLLPRFYQVQISAVDPPGLITFDGYHLWSRITNPDGSVQRKSSTGAPDERLAGLRKVAEYALEYFVMTTSAYPMRTKVVPSNVCSHIAGECIEFRPTLESEARHWVRIVFDAATGRPIATLIPFAGADPGVVISRFGDFRRVKGVQVPFQLTETRTYDSGTPEQRLPPWHYARFDINVNLTPSSFKEPRR